MDPASIAFAALAEEYRRAGQFDEAIETCTAGLKRHPAYLSAHVTLGRALMEVGRHDEARDQFELVLRTAPENLAAIRGLAEIHHRVDDTAGATDRAAVAPPQQPEPLQPTHAPPQTYVFPRAEPQPAPKHEEAAALREVGRAPLADDAPVRVEDETPVRPEAGTPGRRDDESPARHGEEGPAWHAADTPAAAEPDLPQRADAYPFPHGHPPPHVEAQPPAPPPLRVDPVTDAQLRALQGFLQAVARARGTTTSR